MGIGGSLGKAVAPHVHRLAPDVTAGFIREALHRAVTGVGPMPGAPTIAARVLRDRHGDSVRAVSDVIENHVRLAGAQGFVTNLGGLVTATVTIPANIAGLALLQARMVASIACLHGYDVDDPRVRNAILACMLGEDGVRTLLRKRKLPAPPMAIATAPTHDPHLDRIMAAEVTSELLTKIAGKKMVTTIGRRVPVVGGLVGAGADGYATWQIGRYADRELRPRALR
ncbi:MAG TPA: EcsC family protein [Nocardioidaceae bacterium]|nr:EcsC family protein [Nocardioidaceae bacterium]